jgi:hypothetical protein
VRQVKKHAKVVDVAESLFTQDISAATYIGFSSDKNVVGFQLNGSMDWTMLDGLPALGGKDYAKYVVRLGQDKWKTLVTGNQDRDGNGVLDLDDMAEGMSKAGCMRGSDNICRTPPTATILRNSMTSNPDNVIYLDFYGPDNKIQGEFIDRGTIYPGSYEDIPVDVMLGMLKVSDKY